MGEGNRLRVFQPNFDDSGFRVVAVPGEVQLQVGLRDNELYLQSRELTAINQQEWWYRKRFVVPERDHERLSRLVFEGVDYFTCVWLNGEKLGKHEGAYTPFSFDISSALQYGGENHLVVKVTCPWMPKERGFLEYLKGEWTEGDPGDVLRFPFPPYVLGPHWDGLPAGGNAAFPMGLWRDVKLMESGLVVVDQLTAFTRTLNADGSAQLRIAGTIKNFGDQKLSITLQPKVAPENFPGETLSLPPQNLSVSPGESSFSADAIINDAHLWWTWDQGEQNLYRLTATITSGGGLEDSREIVFGIRTISRSGDMSYMLNGRRLFLKGAWYPMADYFGSRATHDTYRFDLELFKGAHLNHLVNFTVVEKSDFYDLCDRLGILVFVEFPFSQFGPMEVLASSNPRREIFVENSLDQLRSIVIQLRNHPSIIVWAAFAEAFRKTGGWGFRDEDFEQYGYAAYTGEIRKLVFDLAPGTIFHPSLCDMGEQHLWMGTSVFRKEGYYSDHFLANTGFVSEYGAIAMPSTETLKNVLSPGEMWSGRDDKLPQWYGLPIDISRYSYLASLEYEGLCSMLTRVHNSIDRDIRSAQELVDASQFYQAFLLKYATEAYRRRKYNSVAGTRVWAYGEACPGIRFSILDYYRVPKIGYYYLKNAQSRFAINFAYQEALESQPCGKQLRIPIWAINDYQHELTLDLLCELRDLAGRPVWSKRLTGRISRDESKEVGNLEFTAPDKAGVYVLEGRAQQEGGCLEAINSVFVKVVPRLFAKKIKLLLIGQREYSLPIAQMARGIGIEADVIEERSLTELERLRNPAAIVGTYHLVWLASFDSLWKLLDDEVAVGLRKAVAQGVGFIHTGGPGSYHGGFGRAACLEFSPLTEILPVKVMAQNDVVFGQPSSLSSTLSERFIPLSDKFMPIKDILVEADAEAGWDDCGLAHYGLLAFNDVQLNPGARLILSILGRPLLVIGQYLEGRTIAFTGFTPPYTERRHEWVPGVEFPYLLDQEFGVKPALTAYFNLFMRMISAALGLLPSTDYSEVISAREKPLFQQLKELPIAKLAVVEASEVKISADRVTVQLSVTNGPQYARLVRIRAEREDQKSPCFVEYSDNYFDLFPGQTRSIILERYLSNASETSIRTSLIIEASNVSPFVISI